MKAKPEMKKIDITLLQFSGLLIHLNSFLALQEWLNSEGVEVNEAEEVPEESELRENEDVSDPR